MTIRTYVAPELSAPDVETSTRRPRRTVLRCNELISLKPMFLMIKTCDIAMLTAVKKNHVKRSYSK
jgi:hypothetical protein